MSSTIVNRRGRRGVETTATLFLWSTLVDRTAKNFFGTIIGRRFNPRPHADDDDAKKKKQWED